MKRRLWIGVNGTPDRVVFRRAPLDRRRIELFWGTLARTKSTETQLGIEPAAIMTIEGRST